MFDFIPTSSYSTVFLLGSCLLLFGQVCYLNFSGRRPLVTYKSNLTLFLLLLAVVILYIGLRPQSAESMGDTRTYVKYFYAVNDKFLDDARDYGFYSLMLFTKNAGLGATFFLVLVASLYVGGVARASYLAFYPCGILLFLAYLTSFSFWTYGINGIRNGVAVVLFIWGVAEYFFGKRPMGLGLILVSFLFHKSVLLLMLLFFVSLWLKDKVKWFFRFWFLCFLVSLVSGHYWENVFVSTGLIGEDYFTRDASDRTFSVSGYRYDFVLYSVVPILVGYYFVYRKKIVDTFYYTILMIYLGANGFWILINQHWLSNRFAFLSWCLYPILLVYPYGRFCAKNVKAKVSLVLLGQAGFSLLMWSIDKYH